MQNPKFLILDEPTAVLTPQEADQLFIVLDRLKAEGRAILYISHKLEEVKRLCDTATILRAGRKIATCNPQAETAASLARMMVGADIKQVKAPAGRQTTVPRLVVNDLSLEPDDPHGVRLKHISLEVKGGEILGIAGVAGNGQDELFAALSGERLAQDPDTVWAEWYRALAELGEPPDLRLPRDLWRFSLTLQRVADLSRRAALRALDLPDPEPDRAQWPVRRRSLRRRTPCRPP